MNVPFLDASLPADHIPISHARARAAHSASRLPSFLSSCLVQSVVATVAFLAIAVATLFAPAGARAQGDAPSLPPVSSPNEVRAGSLLLRDGERYVEAPRVAADIDIDIVVSGPTSRARVTQIFDNPTKNWVEAVYVNPLPDGGAVDTLKMVIGDRFVVGDIKERGEAKAIYEEARRTGRKATLFEQERPNIFTNSVANIGPGERVVVQIEYQEPAGSSTRCSAASTGSMKSGL